ncbi:hypothetical protein AMTR_s00128p00103170 [Amborella trichopoda]|uniref:Uncharacterized protein n=1 Tax=Amborella trichopoda TaxID=13333 RepID=W1NPZ3_AMBTC|nr:hypothetical protein AMTR_s00128p00103170 [Amborella trichopoda]
MEKNERFPRSLPQLGLGHRPRPSYVTEYECTRRVLLYCSEHFQCLDKILTAICDIGGIVGNEMVCHTTITWPVEPDEMAADAFRVFLLESTCALKQSIEMGDRKKEFSARRFHHQSLLFDSIKKETADNKQVVDSMHRLVSEQEQSGMWLSVSKALLLEIQNLGLVLKKDSGEWLGQNLRWSLVRLDEKIQEDDASLVYKHLEQDMRLEYCMEQNPGHGQHISTAAVTSKESNNLYGFHKCNTLATVFLLCKSLTQRVQLHKQKREVERLVICQVGMCNFYQLQIDARS